MANYQIHELTSGTIDRDSNVIHDTLNGGNYETRKATAGAVADLANVNVAAAYDSATTYAIGQYCLYEGDIYRCIAITTGTFDATKWTQIVVTSEFRRVVELTTAQYEALSSAEQNNGTLYVLTDGIPPSETITGSDIIPFIDVSDSNKPKSTTAAAVAGLAKTSVKTTSVTVSGANGQYVTNLDWSDYNIMNAWITGGAYLILIRPSGSNKVVFNIYAYNTGFAPISDATVTVYFSYIDMT